MTLSWVLNLVEDTILSDEGEDCVYVLDLIPNLLWMQTENLLRKDLNQEMKKFEAKVYNIQCKKYLQ